MSVRRAISELESDSSTVSVVENLVLAVGAELFGGGPLAAEHHIHGALARHVLDLASGELEVGGELQCDLGVQSGYH